MMRKYFLSTSISLQNIFINRFRAFVWILADVITLVYAPFLWLAAFGQNEYLGELSKGDVVTYFVLIAIVSLLSYSYMGKYIAEDIFSGYLTKHIVRPWSYLFHEFFSETGGKLINVGVGLIVFLIAVTCFPSYIHFPKDPAQLIWFCVFLVFARIISYLMECIVGLSAFWIQRTWSLQSFQFLADQIIGGRLVPLPLFSFTIQRIFSFLPYPYVLGIPVQVFMGTITGVDLLHKAGLACAWVVVLLFIVRTMWVRGLLRYSGDGK